jgi:hypothetical protein
MVNAKVKVIEEKWGFSLENSMNEFLKTIDVRQIIKTEFSKSEDNINSLIAIIYYIELSDVRDIKIDNVLEVK